MAQRWTYAQLRRHVTLLRTNQPMADVAAHMGMRHDVLSRALNTDPEGLASEQFATRLLDAWKKVDDAWQVSHGEPATDEGGQPLAVGATTK